VGTLHFLNKTPTSKIASMVLHTDTMTACSIDPKKIYRLKEDQAFLLSLELGLKRKGCAASVCRFPPSLPWGGSDFVDIVIAVKML
jgi:hypothetical protein